jgi:putative addiction module component (TIGR02574 family)
LNAATKQVYGHALRLSDSDRAELAAWLIDSLGRGGDDDADAAWEMEIKSRIDELDSGKAATVPGRKPDA